MCYNNQISKPFHRPMPSEDQTQIFLAQQIHYELEKKKKVNTQAPDAYLKKWSAAQNILYGRYLKTHMAQMSNKKKKKCGKFAKMSNFIGSKSQNQCRSHHQKMLLTFKSLQKIIQYIGEVKRRGKLITLQEFQQSFGLNLSQEGENKQLSKIEEQLSTERQSQQEVKNEVKEGNGMRQGEGQSMGLPIREQESKNEDEEIFDVLEISKYSGFFNC